MLRLMRAREAPTPASAFTDMRVMAALTCKRDDDDDRHKMKVSVGITVLFQTKAT